MCSSDGKLSTHDDLIKQELAELRDNDTMTPDLVFKNPYFLEFTGLKGMCLKHLT